MKKVLEGVKVLSFCLAAAGPTTARILKSMGATVYHVEPLAGCSTRVSYAIQETEWNLAGTKNIPLDAKSPEGYEVLKRLIQECDVFVSNYRAKALVKLGLDHETVCKLNPRIVYGMLYAYGPEGPQKDDPGYDTTCYWAKGGMMRDIAEKGTVVVPPIAVGDSATSLSLDLAICAGLYNREKTGKGCYVSASIYATTLFQNNDAIMMAQVGQEYPKSRAVPARALLNSYQTGDGEWITLNANNNHDKNWPYLCKLIGREDLIDKYPTSKSTMFEHAPALTAILDEAFKKFTRDELVEKLRACPTIAVEKVYSSLETISDPQALANGYFFKHTLSNGVEAMMPAVPFCIGDDVSEEGLGGKLPRLGEDTAEILDMLGFSKTEIDDMVAKNVTKLPD